MESLNKQPAAPQPRPAAPTPQPVVSANVAPGKGLAIASMVLGIIAVLTGLFYLGAVLGILAIIFGAIALKKKVGKGMAIAGIVTGSLGILGTILSITLVLLAVPALQQNARDTERKNQVSMAVSDVIQYQTENRGQLPDTATVGQWLNSGELASTTATYTAGQSCEGTESATSFKIEVKLENGENYCQGS